MGKVGILANPASGKDIRRLVSHASIFSNRDKANIVERIVSVIGELGDHDIYVMPDADNVGPVGVNKLHNKEAARKNIHIVEMFIENSINDTLRFVERMRELKVDALIVLGGDGTSRAAAKKIGAIPLIPVSTGTNNVFPELAEGTVVGMAAAALASGLVKAEECCENCKRIEIYRGNELVDIALIDLVVSAQNFIGTKALWNVEDISRIIATQCHPATIGFSALVGCSRIVDRADDFGIMAEFTPGRPNKKAAMAAGMIVPICISNEKIIRLNEDLVLRLKGQGTLALDGEREVMFSNGDEFTVRVTRNGPRRVILKKALEIAHQRGLYNLP